MTNKASSVSLKLHVVRTSLVATRLWPEGVWKYGWDLIVVLGVQLAETANCNCKQVAFRIWFRSAPPCLD
jgi:hypothetical protein